MRNMATVLGQDRLWPALFQGNCSQRPLASWMPPAMAVNEHGWAAMPPVRMPLPGQMNILAQVWLTAALGGVSVTSTLGMTVLPGGSSSHVPHGSPPILVMVDAGITPQWHWCCRCAPVVDDLITGDIFNEKLGLDTSFGHWLLWTVGGGV